jgi:hypothetical protein
LSSGSTLGFPDLPTCIKTTHEPKSTVKVVGPKIVPLVDIEKKAILEAIEQLHGDKLLGGKDAGDREDDAVSQIEGIRPNLN